MRERLRQVRRISVRRILGFGAVLAIIVAASVSGFLVSNSNTDQVTDFGDFDNPNRVEVTAWITKIDTAGQAYSMTVTDVRPFGSLADDSGNFAKDATLFTNAVGNWRDPIKAGDSAPDVEQRMFMTGHVTNYPFDRYQSTMELHVIDGDGTELPTAVTVMNTDLFFQIDTAKATSSTGGTLIRLGIHRSAPTLVFAVFIMVLMLGLSAAAVAAAFYVLHWRRGLIFPACSMMAAILFALIPLRNAVPGSPPIGSIIDFGSFFIAEAIISISLITSVLLGFRHQLSIERADTTESIDEPGEAPGQTPAAEADDPDTVVPA